MWLVNRADEGELNLYLWYFVNCIFSLWLYCNNFGNNILQIYEFMCSVFLWNVSECQIIMCKLCQFKC